MNGEVSIKRLAETLSELPQRTGHQSNPGDVAVIGVNMFGGTGTVITREVPPWEELHSVDVGIGDALYYLEKNTSHSLVGAVVVVNGSQDLQPLDELLQHREPFHPGLKLQVARVTERNGGRFVAVREASEKFWGPEARLEPAPSDGRPIAENLAQAIANHRPLDQPLYSAQPPAHLKDIGKQPPSVRAAQAFDALYRLGTPNGRNNPTDLAAVAHIAFGSSGGQRVKVRDAILLHAMKSPDTTQALIDVYRAAPAEMRQEAAATAGAAIYQARGQRLLAGEVLKHAGDQELAQVTKTQMTSDDRLSHHPYFQNLEPKEVLAISDQSWQAQQLHSLSFPSAALVETQRVGDTPEAVKGTEQQPSPGIER